MRQKAELDRRTARELGLKEKDVAIVTDEFITQISLLLIESGTATVDNLGRFKIEFMTGGKGVILAGRKRLKPGTTKLKVSSYTRVHFAKSKALKQLLAAAYKEE